MFVILNEYGALWTAETFQSKQEAQQYLEGVLTWIEPSELKHTIVPKETVPDFDSQVEYLMQYENMI